MIKRLSRKYFGHVNKPSTALHRHYVGFPNYILTYLQHDDNVAFGSTKLKPQKNPKVNYEPAGAWYDPTWLITFDTTHDYKCSIFSQE